MRIFAIKLFLLAIITSLAAALFYTPARSAEMKENLFHPGQMIMAKTIFFDRDIAFQVADYNEAGNVDAAVAMTLVCQIERVCIVIRERAVQVLLEERVKGGKIMLEQKDILFGVWKVKKMTGSAEEGWVLMIEHVFERKNS